MKFNYKLAAVITLSLFLLKITVADSFREGQRPDSVGTVTVVTD